MGLAGQIGAGAAEGLEDVLMRQLREAVAAEQVRSNQAQEGLRGQALAQDQSQHSDVMGLRTREQDMRERLAQEESEQQGMDMLRDDQARSTVRLDKLQQQEDITDAASDESIPAPVRRMLGVFGRTGQKVAPGDLLTEDEIAARETAADNRDVSKASRIAEASAAATARHRPPPKTGVAGLEPGQLQTAKQFQDDYARDSKTYLAVRNAYQQVAGAAQQPDAAGDLSLIFGYMKMLDPNSVVRETEFANAQNAAGVPDQVRNLYNRAISGERLNPNQRQQFVGQARRLIQTAHANQSKVRNTYSNRATKFGIPADMVLDDEDPIESFTGQGPADSGAPAKKFTIIGVQ